MEGPPPFEGCGPQKWAIFAISPSAARRISSLTASSRPCGGMLHGSPSFLVRRKNLLRVTPETFMRTGPRPITETMTGIVRRDTRLLIESRPAGSNRSGAGLWAGCHHMRGMRP